jgi:hypothetical protein
MGIPIGATLFFTRGQATVMVTGPRKVSLDGAQTSLTAATPQLLGIAHGIAPGPYWTFNGRTVREIYNETDRVPS